MARRTYLWVWGKTEKKRKKEKQVTHTIDDKCTFRLYRHIAGYFYAASPLLCKEKMNSSELGAIYKISNPVS